MLLFLGFFAAYTQARFNVGGVFFRTPWVEEVSSDTLNSWFSLVARGKSDVSSPYHVKEFAIQNIGCNQMDPIGPPCNASAPTNSKQAKGHYNMTYGQLWENSLSKLVPFFSLFESVSVGTLWVDGFNCLDKARNTASAQAQADVAQRFLTLYPSIPNMGWYLTMEDSLNSIGESAEYAAGMLDFLTKSMNALNAVRQFPSILWSPYFHKPYSSYDAQGLAVLEQNLGVLFCNLPTPLRLHYQDILGQSVIVDFPFIYNYSHAFTCEGDSVPYYRLLQRVQSKCPMLIEVKANAELFAEKLSPDGERGENNGAFILNANPAEVSSRLECYEANNADVGVCWAMPHWYSIWSFLNSTVYQPY